MKRKVATPAGAARRKRLKPDPRKASIWSEMDYKVECFSTTPLSFC
ncbi:hypothetical protein [Planococcus chinensis]|nr:hypothetical protein [Planococcus chinensis]